MHPPIRVVRPVLGYVHDDAALRDHIPAAVRGGIRQVVHRPVHERDVQHAVYVSRGQPHPRRVLHHGLLLAVRARLRGRA